MKRSLVIEDWSRFNRAVLDVADALPQRVARKPPPPKRDIPEPLSEPGETGDRYGLITRNKWRKQA